MPYRRDVGYTRDQLTRDITFLFHECADHNHIYGDNDYWALLRGPYYDFFEEGKVQTMSPTIVAEDGLTVMEAQFSEIERALYDRCIRGYFAERA